MMNFIEIAKKRYSVRNYSGKKVEKEKLDKILQAAHVAPTAANLQPVHLIAVESKEGLEKISKGANIYNSQQSHTIFMKTKSRRPIIKVSRFWLLHNVRS